MAKSKKSIPKKCGDAFVLRCIGPDKSGKIYRCSVFPMNSSRSCAGAVINIDKGTIRFYE